MSQAPPITKRTAAAGATGAAGPRLGLALLVIATAQLMVVLDATIVNVALPHIQHALGFSGSGLEWVVNAYALAFGGLLLLGGRAGDLLGRRKVFIAGLLLFSAASLAGGFATSQAWLLAARAVQGAGAAIIAPTALALITTTFPEGPPRNRAMGVYAAMSVAGGAVGLIAGGLLTTYASWRWVLFVNVPIGLAVGPGRAAGARRVARGSRGRFDLPGAITGTGGLAALVYGLSNAATSPDGVSHWGDAKVVASLAASVVLLAAFAVIEARSKHPLLPLRLLRDRDRTGANLIMLCVGTALFGMFFFLTVFLQAVWGYSRAEDRRRLPADDRPPSWCPPAPPPSSSPGSAPGRCCWLAPSATGGGMYWLSRISEHGSYAGGVLGPMLRHRRRARPAVRAGHPRRHVPRRRPGLRGRLQLAQYRPAGRRLDRAGRARHCRLDRRGQQRPRPGRPRSDRSRGRLPGAAQPGGAHHDLPPRPGQRILPGLPGHRRDHAARPGHHDHRDPAAARRPRRGPALNPPRDKEKDHAITEEDRSRRGDWQGRPPHS